MLFKLQPNRVRRTYRGGGRIDCFTGTVADCRDGVPRPEDWLASTTTAFNGAEEIEGEGLGRLEDGRAVKDVVGGLPILVKLLDSDERLVVQAHPTVPCAERLFNSRVGKTECWYFLPGTAPDACVYLGFKPGVTRTAWEKAVCEFSHKEHKEHKNNRLLEMLHCIPVAPGDFVFVDGGVPHAIGAGCFMVELQEPSDLMVVAERFTPSGRRIPDAKMHGGVGWEKMFDVYGYEGLGYEEVSRRYVRRDNVELWNCENMELWKYENESGNGANVTQICGPGFTDKFSMWRIAQNGRLSLCRDHSVVVVTDGVGALNGIAVKKGDRLLVADERSLEAEGNASFVVCS